MDAKDYQHALKALLGLIMLVFGAWLAAYDGSVPTPEAEMLVNGGVTRVVDGDTLDVVIDGQVERVRLIGIDTPETLDPRRPVQCFGEEASQHLSELLLNETVTLEFDTSQGRADNYDRTLAYVILDDGTNVAEKMLRDGFAYEYTYDQPYKYQELFKNAEQDARDSDRGLWSSETCGGNR